jgi:hypothetical protein
MKSQRQDGRGHWARGKQRSTLTAAQVATVLRRLNKALEEQSMIQVAKVVGISDTQVRRIVRGDDLPSQRTYELVTQRL